MLRAVIIDDEKEARINLDQLLKLHTPHVEVTGQADGVKSGVALIKKEDPQLVFLDIQMQDGSGFDLLNYFTSPSFHVVFVTAYDSFAIKAFEFNAIDYLLKPIHRSRLLKSIEKVDVLEHSDDYFRQLTSLISSYEKKAFDMITLQTSKGRHFIQLEDIVRLEADRNYTTFYCLNRKRIVVSGTIKKYEQLLPEGSFFRSHQSHIINMKYVKAYRKESGGIIEMRDEQQVPLARRKKEQFFNWMKKKATAP